VVGGKQDISLTLSQSVGLIYLPFLLNIIMLYAKGLSADPFGFVVIKTSLY